MYNVCMSVYKFEVQFDEGAQATGDNHASRSGGVFGFIWDFLGKL